MLSSSIADIRRRTTRCAVLGRPIAHSLSPVMHRAAYAELGLTDWSYEAFDVGEDELAGFLASLDESWRGLSLTMPLKRTVLDMLDQVTARARRVAAVNTVLFGAGTGRTDAGSGRQRAWFGDNTDVLGVREALRERGIDRVGHAAVLGAGATAASTVSALCELGLREVVFGVRSVSRAGNMVELARSWGLSASAEPLGGPMLGAGTLGAGLARRSDVLASTVPASAVEPYAEVLVGAAGVVLDVVYDPWPTSLMAAAEAAGVPAVSGIDLLAHQAAGQVELMTGQTVAAAVLRGAACEELSRR